MLASNYLIDFFPFSNLTFLIHIQFFRLQLVLRNKFETCELRSFFFFEQEMYTILIAKFRVQIHKQTALLVQFFFH